MALRKDIKIVFHYLKHKVIIDILLGFYGNEIVKRNVFGFKYNMLYNGNC